MEELCPYCSKNILVSLNLNIDSYVDIHINCLEEHYEYNEKKFHLCLMCYKYIFNEWRCYINPGFYVCAICYDKYTLQKISIRLYQYHNVNDMKTKPV